MKKQIKKRIKKITNFVNLFFHRFRPKHLFPRTQGLWLWRRLPHHKFFYLHSSRALSDYGVGLQVCLNVRKLCEVLKKSCFVTAKWNICEVRNEHCASMLGIVGSVRFSRCSTFISISKAWFSSKARNDSSQLC